MLKRKFDKIDKDWENGNSENKPNQNSLDSDEEEEEPEATKYALKEEDIEGQEEGGAIMEEGVQFTPFNMKEEMEEGHFDKDGMYHWNKEKNIRDNWLEDIDWVKIKNKEVKDITTLLNDDEMPEAVDTIKLYRKILSFMKPKETIAKSLQRLGGNKSLSASERLKLKKAGLIPKTTKSEGSENVTELTELANKILTHSGNMDIYQETYEQINDMVNASSSRKQKEPELDMYADDFGAKEQERLNDSAPNVEKSSNSEVSWEYKDEESSKVMGPFTSEQMEKYMLEGKFGKGVLVRKCGTTQFYNSSRMDFALYF